MNKFCLIFALCVYIPLFFLVAAGILIGPATALIEGDFLKAIGSFILTVIMTVLLAAQVILISHVLGAKAGKAESLADKSEVD